MHSLNTYCLVFELISHTIGKFWHPNGDRYEGQFVDSKAHGFGKYSSTAGGGGETEHIYEGEWKKDKKHGTGKETMEDG